MLFAVYVGTVEIVHLENMPVILWQTGGDTRVNAAGRPLTVRGQECITGNYRLTSKCGCSVCMTMQTISIKDSTIHTKHYSRVAYVIESFVYIVGVFFKRYSIHGLGFDVLRFRPFCMPDKAFEAIF